MAENERTRRRTAPVVNDSLARDLSRQTARRSSTAPQQRPEQQTRPETQPQVGLAFRRMSVKPVAIALLAVAMFLGVYSYRIHAQIVEVNREIYLLEKEMEVAAEEQDTLEIRYESAFNFTQLEDYAVTTLGMQRPRDEQIYYLTSNTEDHAVAVAERSSSHGLLDRMTDFISELRSYLH